MDQSNKFGEPSPSTTPEQTRPPRASLPSNFTRSVPGDPRSHGSIAHHPRHQPPPPPPPPIPDLQDMAEMPEDVPHGRPRRPWSSPDPNMMVPYPSREGHSSHPVHHPEPSSSSSSRRKNEPYFHSRHHLNPASAHYGHPFPTEELPRTSPPSSDKPPAHGYMPSQGRITGSVPLHFSEVDAIIAQDRFPDQTDDNSTVDLPLEQWYPSSGPPDWRHGYDPRDHNVRSPDLYRGDPYPYTHPYHPYRPPGPGMARPYGSTNGWPYRYDYDPRSYMRYGPQPWTRPGPVWDYVSGSRYSELGRYRPPPPEYRGDSFEHPGWVQRYPYAHDPPYETQAPDSPDAPYNRQQKLQLQLQQPQYQDHYTIANDNYSRQSGRYEDMELRRHQAEYSYQREGHGSDTPPSPPLEASASKAKTTTPPSATTVSAAQKQNAVDTQDGPTKQEPGAALRPRQDGRNQGPSLLTPDQTSSANKTRPHARGSPKLPQESPILISAPRDSLIQAPPELHKRGWPAGSLPKRVKADPKTDHSSTLPPERIPGYKPMPSRDIYPEAPLPDPKLAPSMRHDREGMRTQNLDGRSSRMPTHPLEVRGRAGSLPGYLVHPPGFQRDGIPPPPPTTGSPSGIGSLKATISFSPSNSTALPVIPSSSLSPPPVKLGHEGYYRQRDLKQLFRIWKADYEHGLSRLGKYDHLHHRIADGQDDGENMESHGSSSSNNGTTTPTGPSWREKAKWKWNAMLQEYGSDGKKRKTMNDHRAGRTEDVDEDIDEYRARGRGGGEGGGGGGGGGVEGREDGQVDEFEGDPMEEDEDSEEDDDETDPQGESRKRRTDSAGETSESGSSQETHKQQESRDPRHYGMNHHPTGSSGPSTQPTGSSSGTPLDPNVPRVTALATKRRIRVRESKNHECKICGKRFSRPSQLQTHSFTHSGEKPHQCHMCYKHFNVASNLKRHIRTHASSCRKSSRIGNTVFRGFALGYPTRTLNESTQTTGSTSANSNPSQDASNTDDNSHLAQTGSSGVQGHATRVRRTERPTIKHPQVTDSTEVSKSNGSSNGSGSSTSRVPVMPPPSAPSNHPGSSQVPGRKESGQGRKGQIGDDVSVEVPDTEV